MDLADIEVGDRRTLDIGLDLADIEVGDRRTLDVGSDLADIEVGDRLVAWAWAGLWGPGCTHAHTHPLNGCAPQLLRLSVSRLLRSAMAAKKRKTGLPESSAKRKARRQRRKREKQEEKQEALREEEEEGEGEEEEEEDHDNGYDDHDDHDEYDGHDEYDHDSPEARARRVAFLETLSPPGRTLARGLWAARGWWVPP